MKIIKRNGAEVPFDITKIITAVTKASDSVGGQARLSREQITQIAAAVTDQCQQLNRAVSVEEVQDLVENQLMDIQAHDVARHYITYRYVQSLKRQTNTTDERILSLIECQNEEVKQENANKNPTVNSVQRDYMAGEISKDLTARLLLDPEIVKAHQEGLIHFHDSDYFAQHMHNCDLVNLEDMLQNGTVISGTYIEKPHSFSTACNIATQIIAQVASNQYGGQSISLTHLAPFVDVSRKKIAAEVELEMEGLDVSAERKKEIVERRLRNEINRGVQTIQYQVVTLMTTNGQAPFITVFMYLGEARNPQEKADLAIIIEETIRQRYQGVKNEAGVWITPAFPKLIYVLEEDNIRPGTPYYYLTELAAKCTAKRMVPDYISEKKMLELKVDKNGEGHCYTCMGCRSFLTPYVDPETGKPKYYGRFCTQVAGVETIGGSSVIGFMGYYVIALLSTVCVTFLHKVCVVVIEWAFGLLLKLAHSKIKDEAKREELICTFRPQLKNMTLLGDSLVVIGLSAFAVFFVMNYAYALPMTLLAHKLAGIVASSANIILKGAVIGFALGFDVGGPLSLAVFDEIFKGVLAGSMESARLLTVFSAAMITPSWICMIYLFVGKKFKSWPMVVYDENLLNTGFINEVFQNVRLMAMSPMVYCVREPQTTPFALIGGTTLTGILAAAFGICNESFLTDYARKYGLLRTSTIVVTDKYDAFAGLLPPLYAGGGAKVILLSFAAALVGSLLGVGIVVLLKKARYSKQEKRGEDLFLAYGYEFTQQEWNETYKKKSKLEQKLGLAGDIEENEPELEPAE